MIIALILSLVVGAIGAIFLVRKLFGKKQNVQAQCVNESEEILEYPSDPPPDMENMPKSCGEKSIDEQIGDIEALGMPQNMDTVDFDKLNLSVQKILEHVNSSTTRDEFDKLLKIIRREVKHQFSNPQLLYGYRIHCIKQNIPISNHLVTLMQKKTMRSQSGVVTITLFLGTILTFFHSQQQGYLKQRNYLAKAQSKSIRMEIVIWFPL